MALTRRHFTTFGGMFASLVLLFAITSSADAAVTLSVCGEGGGCGFQTIQSAIDAIPSAPSQSYVVEIRDSRTYEESVTISGKTTSATKTITLRTSADATPVILSKAYASAIRLHYQSYVTIDGLSFSGGLKAYAGGVNIDGGSHNTIRNARFSALHKTTAVVVYGAGDNMIEKNIFEKSIYASGIVIYFYNSGNIVRQNTFINIQKGVVLGNKVRSNTITDNTFLLDGKSDVAIASQDIDLGRMQLSRINNNRYLIARGAKFGVVQGKEYTTFSEWQTATGFDRDSTLVVSPENPSFRAWSEVTKTVCASGCDYATIAAAVEAIPSDVSGVVHELITRNTSYRIEVRDAGPYDGGINIDVVTDADRTLTITAASGIRPVINQSPYKNGFYIRYSDYVTIRGFVFLGGQRTNFFGSAILVEGRNNTIEDNRIENTPNAPGIVVHGGSDNRILANQIRNTSRGVFIYAWSSGHTIQGNTIADTFSAVGMNDRTSDIRIEGNTFFHNQRGIDIGGDRAGCFDKENKSISCNYTVRNNIMVTDGSTHAGFVFAKAVSRTSLLSDYNLFWGTSGALVSTVEGVSYATLPFWQSEGQDVHSLFADPLFSDTIAPPYDFHVQSKGGRFLNGTFVVDLAHSPAIDTGGPSSLFSGESFPHGDRVNIGAFGNTVQASRSFVAAPPPPPPASVPKDGAWIDTTSTDWEPAQKVSTVVTGVGSASSITLGGQNEAWESVVIGTQETIGNVAFIDENNGFAVGSNGTILRWNGTAWSTVASGTTANLWDVAFVNSTSGFAIGSSGTILRWNGTAWSAVSSGTTEHLLGLSIVSSNNAWVVGTNGTILRWNGTAWSTVASGTVKTLNAVQMTSSTNGWIAGNGGTIFRWNGTAWSAIASGTTFSLMGIDERSDGSVIVIGDGGFIARYNGSAWTPHATLTGSALLAMTFLPNGRGWIVGEADVVLETQNGITWTLASMPESAEAFFATAIIGATQWVMGTNGAAFKNVRMNTAEGTVTSRVFDAGATPEWKTIAWAGQAPQGTSVRIQFATSTSFDGSWNFVGPDGTTTSFYTGGESPLPTLHTGQRFARYRIVLVRGEGVDAPVVNDVTIRYRYESTAAPVAPTIVAPRNGVLVNSGTLQWSSIPGATSYDVEIGGEIKPAGNALSLLLLSLADGTYTWRIRATTAQGESPWSSAHAFTLDRTAPLAPQNLAPATQNTLVATPVFSWNAVNGAIAYQFQLSTASDFSLPLINKEGISTTNFVPPFSFANGGYFWRVRSYDRAGNPSVWSEAQFTIAAVEPPPVVSPPLLAPTHGISTNNPSLTFRWESVPDARSYLLEVSAGASFIDTVFPPTIVGATEFAWTATEEGPYYWRVRAVNNGGNGPWSSEHLFTLKTTSPPAVVLLDPAEGALVTDPAVVQFAWEPVPDAIKHILEVGNRREEDIVETSFQFEKPFDAGTYLWRVQSIDAAGNMSEATGTSFTVVSSGLHPPAPPSEGTEKPRTEPTPQIPEKKEEVPTPTPPKTTIQETPQEESQPTIPLKITEIIQTPTQQIKKPEEIQPSPSQELESPSTQITQTASYATAPTLILPPIINTNPPVFEGRTGAPQETVTFSVNNQRIGSTVSDSEGRFIFPSPARLLEGENTVTLESVSGSTTTSLIIDTTPPPTPTIAEARIVSREVVAEGEMIFARLALRVSATGDAERLILLDENGMTAAEFFATGDVWYVAPLRDTAGEKSYTIIAVDRAGNRSASSSAIAIALDPSPFVSTCSDGTDNDGNGETDYPLDVTCPTPFAEETSSFVERGVQDIVAVVTTTVTNTVEAARRVTEGTAAVTAVVAEQTEKMVKKAEPIAAPALSVAAPLAIAMNPMTAGSLPAIPGMATHAFSWLFSALGLKKKRKNPWGMVYDAITKEPIGLAILRLFDTANKRLLATQVTDASGRFEFLIKPGTYRLEVVKTPYIFPSAIVTGKGDGDFLDVYHGETVTVEHEGQAMHVNIPLDPENPATHRAASFLATIGRIRRMVGKASLPILILGTGASVVMYSFSQTNYNLLVLLVYIGFAAYQTMLAPKNMKSWGTVFDAVTLAPVPLANVSIIDPQFSRIVKTRLSDYEGRFTFLPELGNYQLKVTKQDYIFPSIKATATRKYRHLYIGDSITVEKKKAIIAVDIPLDPVRDRPAEGTATAATGRPVSNGVDPRQTFPSENLGGQATSNGASPAPPSALPPA